MAKDQKAYYQMTVTKWDKIWPYIWLGIIVLVVFPLVNAIFVVFIDLISYSVDNGSVDFRDAQLVWARTLIYYNWTFTLIVLLPYGFLYINTVLKRKIIIYKMMFFYGLFILNGILIPEASVNESFKPDRYPEAWVIYFLLTIVFCPLCNIALNRLVKNRELMNSS